MVGRGDDTQRTMVIWTGLGSNYDAQRRCSSSSTSRSVIGFPSWCPHPGLTQGWARAASIATGWAPSCASAATATPVIVALNPSEGKDERSLRMICSSLVGRGRRG